MYRPPAHKRANITHYKTQCYPRTENRWVSGTYYAIILCCYVMLLYYLIRLDYLIVVRLDLAIRPSYDVPML